MRRALALAAVAAALIAPAAHADSTAPYWQRHGCEHGHKSKKAYSVIRSLVHNTDPAVRQNRVQHWATCLATRAKAHRAHELARAYRAWRRRAPQVFRILLLRHYPWALGWLDRTRWCESRNDYTAVSAGGKYRGGYQFDYLTWREAGGVGDPAAAHPWEQDYRAAKLLAIAGPSRWPECG